MRSASRLLAGGSLALALAASFGAADGAAQEVPLSVTYGPRASTAEGDPDHREVIFLSVPDDIQERLFLRVFDPDGGGEHDHLYGAGPDSETRFTLYGGKTPIPRPPRPHPTRSSWRPGPRSRPAPPAPTRRRMVAGGRS
jgi:large repetitive protein